MKTVSYKGFQASVEYDAGALFVRVLHIDDVLITQVKSVDEIEAALKDLIDAYLEDCRELGKQPARPFSGTFNVRVNRELHRQAAVASAAVGMSLNAWVADAISQKLECDRLSDRVGDVLRDVRSEVQLLQAARHHTSRSVAAVRWVQGSVSRHVAAQVMSAEDMVRLLPSVDQATKKWRHH